MCSFFSFLLNAAAPTETYTLSLHDALPIFCWFVYENPGDHVMEGVMFTGAGEHHRSEEHTSELQSRQYLVCRLLLEKKKQQTKKETQATDTPMISNI